MVIWYSFQKTSMNTLGSLRYAVMCKKYTCFGLLSLPPTPPHFMWVLQALCQSVPVHSCSSTSFCHVSSSFCATSFLTCSRHDPSPPLRCLPFSVMSKIFSGVISSFICFCVYSLILSLHLFVHSIICSFVLSFFVSFSFSTCLCNCILLFITLLSKHLFSVLIFFFS